MQDVIQAIQAAEDKDTLERIGRDVLKVEVDKRKGIDTIRKLLIDAAEGKDEGQVGGDASNDDQPQGEPRKKQRRMRHRVTGRILLWTPHLEKHKDMVEIEEG